MKDLQFPIENLDQRASGTIEVTDYQQLSGATFTVGATTLTEGVDFDAEIDNETTASNLATAIDGISGVNSSADGSIVTIHADAPGLAGNSIALDTNATDGVTLSGATLEGGVDAIYSDVLELEEGLGGVEASIYISEFTGASGNLTITLQYSYDKSIWFDDADSAFTVIDSGASLPFQESKEMTFSGIYVRFKIVTSGVISHVVGELFARGVEGGGNGGEGGNAGGVADQTPTAIGDNRKTLSGTNTAEQLISASTPCKGVVISALETNAANGFAGSSSVKSASGTERGYLLRPGMSQAISIDNANKIYIAGTAGDKFVFGFVN